MLPLAVIPIPCLWRVECHFRNTFIMHWCTSENNNNGEKFAFVCFGRLLILEDPLYCFSCFGCWRLEPRWMEFAVAAFGATVFCHTCSRRYCAAGGMVLVIQYLFIYYILWGKCPSFFFSLFFSRNFLLSVTLFSSHVCQLLVLSPWFCDFSCSCLFGMLVRFWLVLLPHLS